MKLKTILLSTIASTMLATTLSATMPPATIMGGMTPPDPTEKVVTVNGVDVTGQAIANMTQGQLTSVKALPKDMADKILETIVQQEIMRQYVEKSDIKQTQAFKDNMKAAETSIAMKLWYDSQIKKIDTGKESIEKYFNENKELYGETTEYKASHILVKSEDEAKSIIDTLNKSKNLVEDFGKLAKEKSTGPSAANNGKLGWFSTKQMVPEFGGHVKELGKGKISQKPVKTQYGWHVVYLEDSKTVPAKKLSEVEDDIKNAIIKETMDKDLKSLVDSEMKKAKIVYH